VFLAYIMSYSTVSGMGLTQNLIIKAAVKQQQQQQGIADEGAENKTVGEPEEMEA
jgi:hypothetical protein